MVTKYDLRTYPYKVYLPGGLKKVQFFTDVLYSNFTSKEATINCDFVYSPYGPTIIYAKAYFKKQEDRNLFCLLTVGMGCSIDKK